LANGAIDPATRQNWLNTLLEGVLRDVNIGGMDFADGARDAVIEFSTDAECQFRNHLVPAYK
jgi:hypothetical protein